jgi:hypothetical protein
MDLPFDRTNIGLRERPVSSDINRAESQIYRTITDLMQQLFGGSASPRSGFIGPALAVSALSPSAMSVQVAAGMGFSYVPADVPSDIGATDLEGVDDLSPYKPIVLNGAVTFAVPAAPVGPSTRIDIIEVRVNRLLTDSTPREQLDTVSKTFQPHNFYKTLTFSVDGSTGFIASPNASVQALSYKIGAAGNPGVAPAVTPGYVQLCEIHVGSGVIVINANNIIDKRSVLMPAGAYVGRRVFTVSGNYTPTPGTRVARVIACGGGGGAGAAQAAAGGQALAVGGGATGSLISGSFAGAPVTGGAITIGQGGAGGAAGGANNGANGGDTSFTINGVVYTAKGGGGSSTAASAAAPSVAGGGAITFGSAILDYQAANAGSPGIAAAADNAIGGNGGASPLGTGGMGTTNANGGQATGYGSGGGGSASTQGGASHKGGDGANGVVIIDEFV